MRIGKELGAALTLVLSGTVGPSTRAGPADVRSLIETAQDSACLSNDSGALTDAEIEEAIAWGTSERKPYAYLYGPIAGGIAGGLFAASGRVPSIIAMGPFGRVATEAATAKRRYATYNRASVSRATLAPVLIVRIEPPAPKTGPNDAIVRAHQPTRIEHVVLQRNKDDTNAVQPLSTQEEPFQWQNGFGATFTGTGLTATFCLRDVPSEDFDIVVISSGDEVRARVDTKRRVLLR